MKSTHVRVRQLIREVRSRHRRRVLTQGAAIVVGVFAIWGSGLLLLRTVITPTVWLIAFWTGAVVVAIAATRYLVWPLRSRPDDKTIALYIEEKLPSLEDRLNAAVEIDDPTAARRAHGALIDHLIDDAAAQARSLPVASIVSHQRERRLLFGSALALLAFFIVGIQSLGDLRSSLASGSLLPTPPPYMTVQPGNVEIEQGESQSVVVTLREASSRSVILHYEADDGSWRQAMMEPAIGEPAYLHEFLNIQRPIRYFVEHGTHRSGSFEITLYTFPSVASIDHTVHYPAYTGRTAERVEGSGDVRALRGSEVVLDVGTNGRAERAELVFDEGGRIEMEAGEDGRFRARLRIDSPDFYQVRLLDREGKSNKFPTSHRITPVEDLPPQVTVTIPQRDVRANAVEEVLVAARAEDDFGLRSLRLRFAVNAGDEQTIDLTPPDASRPVEVDGEHLFFLEDFGLQPGDVISYFVEAEDHSGKGAEATDMYFVEVIPFDREYTQVAGGGGSPMGGQNPSGVVLSQQQVIAATWKLVRERDRMSDSEHAQARRDLAQAQTNLRQNLEGRISETAFSLELQRNAETRQIADLLRQAADAMQQAVVQIDRDRLREALTPEREALNHLLRADALNRERQVALNRNNQPGGSASAQEERMTELMDLELDISKDKYETLQESSPSGPSPEMDDAMRRLQELARRQEQLARQGERQLEGEDRRRQVERLQREQQELQQQAQALSEQMRRLNRRDPNGGQSTEEQLERVLDRMRQAESSLREGEVERARAQQQQALNELDRIAENMQRSGGQSSRSAIEEMQQTMDELREREARLENDLRESLSRAAQGRIDRNELQRLTEERQASREAIERLDRTAEALAGGQDPDLASAARDLQRAVQRTGLDRQLEESEDALRRGWLDNAGRRQNAIRQGLDALEESMRAFQSHVPLSEEEQLARALESVRDLERELRLLEEATNREAGAADADGQAATNGGDVESSERGARGDAARRQARMARATDQLDRLEEALRDSPDGQPLGGIRRALSRADNQDAPMSRDEADAFFRDHVFAPLSQLEQALTQQLDRFAMARKLRGSRPDDVPAEYRALVERYYEALSRD